MRFGRGLCDVKIRCNPRPFVMVQSRFLADPFRLQELLAYHASFSICTDKPGCADCMDFTGLALILDDRMVIFLASGDHFTAGSQIAR